MTRREFLAAGALASAGTALACRPAPRQDAATREAPPQDPGFPVTQVLVVGGLAGAFSAAYVEEMLRAEGVLGVAGASAREAPPPALDVPAVVIVGRGLTPAWVGAAERYVRSGGGLVAIVPGAELAPLLGLRPGGTPRAPLVSAGIDTGEDGWESLDVPVSHETPGGEPGWSVGGEGVRIVAWGESEAGQRIPVVIDRTVGRGQCCAWLVDVARAVAWRRQGDPRRRGEHDGLEGVRLADALAGAMPLDHLERPDADAWQRGLVASIARVSRARGPIVRLSHFPNGAEGVLVATADAHGVGAAALATMVDLAEARGAHVSFYYSPPATPAWRSAARGIRWWAADRLSPRLQSPGGPPSPGLVERWRARGHEFAPHPDVEAGLGPGLRDAFGDFVSLGYGGRHQTLRTHKVLWSPWIETARQQRDLGVRLNLDAYHVGPAFGTAGGHWAHGHMIGSGLPMKFVGEDGAVVDCYQQPTQLVDEQWLAAFGGPERLAPGEAVAAASRLFDQTRRHPAAWCGNFHADGFAVNGEPAEAARTFFAGVLDAVRQRHWPIYSAGEWLRFLDGRRAWGLTRREWDDERNTLRVSLRPPPMETGRPALWLPARDGQRGLAVVTGPGGRRISHHAVEWTRALAALPLEGPEIDVAAVYRP